MVSIAISRVENDADHLARVIFCFSTAEGRTLNDLSHARHPLSGALDHELFNRFRGL